MLRKARAGVGPRAEKRPGIHCSGSTQKWVLVTLGKVLRKTFSKTESSLIKKNMSVSLEDGLSCDKRPLYCPVVRSVLGKAR